MGSQHGFREIKGIRGAIYRLEQLQARTAFAAGGLASFLRLRIKRNGSRPAVAAVLVGRNDDYMSDFVHRLRATIAWNAKYLVDEVVFVEWNPPADRELLSLDLTKRFEFLRAYVVPPEVHQAICENQNIALLEYHAKNVGIRRALSPWIITTNADAAFGLDSVDTILHSDLLPQTVWTTQRADIPWREGRQHGMSVWDSLRYRRLSPYQRFGTGEFCFASRELWHQIRGFDETMVRHRFGCDVRGTAQMVAHGATINKIGTVLHLSHPTSCSEGVQAHHGEAATTEGLPYHNPDDWGLGNCREVQLAERVWRLE